MSVSTEELQATRDYARSAATCSLEEVIAGCRAAIDRYGFAVIDDVIPTSIGHGIERVRSEVELQTPLILDNLRTRSAKVVPGPMRQSEPCNDLEFLPEFRRHLASPFTTGLARAVLDDHVRIAQIHVRPIAADSDATSSPEKPSAASPADPSDAAHPTIGTGERLHTRGAEVREWHTDWPHDLIAYGGGEDAFCPAGGAAADGQASGRRNAGAVRQPFPDACMCLTMIWYLTDVDADSAATWVVPGWWMSALSPRAIACCTALDTHRFVASFCVLPID